jgi:D-alanyl-D-alanine dipeptidase
VDLQGREQKMATDFDDFSPAARSPYSGTDEGVAARMRILRTTMINAGFAVIRDEWWHFSVQEPYLFGPVEVALEGTEN